MTFCLSYYTGLGAKKIENGIRCDKTVPASTYYHVCQKIQKGGICKHQRAGTKVHAPTTIKSDFVARAQKMSVRVDSVIT